MSTIALSTLFTRFQKLIGDKNGTYLDYYADAINNSVGNFIPIYINN